MQSVCRVTAWICFYIIFKPRKEMRKQRDELKCSFARWWCRETHCTRFAKMFTDFSCCDCEMQTYHGEEVTLQKAEMS